MSRDEFWNLVERVNVSSGGDMSRKCELLGIELRRLPPAEVKAFDRNMRELFFQAYRWELWGAAYLMDGGCGDDSFMDFRYTLISMGRQIYEAALANPDSLARIDCEHPTFEGYQYVSSQVYEELMQKNGVSEQQLFEEQERESASAPRHPREAAGEEFREWEMEDRYPKLTTKFGHRDADYAHLEAQAAKIREREEKARRLADLLLDAGIVPSCGKIPPFGVVARVFRTGHAPAAIGNSFSWEPFELAESDYWRMLRHLERPDAEQLNRRPNLRSVVMQLDPQRVPDDDYDRWLESLRARGLG